MNKYIEKFNFYIITFLILAVPLSMTINIFFPNSIIIYYNEILELIIPFEIFIYLYNLIKKNTKFNKYDLIIILWFILDIFVTMNAVNTKISIWGAYNRYEGLISISSYYLLFLNAKALKEERVEKIISVIFCLGIVEFIYSFFQIFVRSDSIFKFELYEIKYMASGTIGNPNMLGSFCVLLLCLSISLYLIYKNKKYLILSIIFFINLLLTCSTGPFLSFCLVFVLLLCFLYKNKYINIKKIIQMIILFLITFIITTYGSEIYFKKVFNDEIKESYSIKNDIVKLVTMPFNHDNNIEEDSNLIENVNEFSNGRIKIWKNTLKIAPNYLLLGAGLDNFGFVYPQTDLPNYVNKAHNEYLQILITEGIFGLLLYLILIVNLFIDGIRSNNKLVWCLLASFIVYIIQAFFNIRTITVAPIYFIVIGVLSGLTKKEA